MIQFHIFPGGKRRIVTFSYDDGNVNDIRLVELLNRYGVKGTFHLNAVNYLGISGEEKLSIRRRYEGHEISCHTVHHGWPARMPVQSVVRETLEDRRVLEEIAGYPVIGMSYPSNSFSPAAVEAIRSCGIVYSRCANSAGSMELPQDFLRWIPTCHHRDALALCPGFLERLDSEWAQPLFYIWGHSHELRTEEDWAYMDKLVSTLAGNDKIWYATSLEIWEYMTAQRALRISVDEHTFMNPTNIDLWVERDKKDVIRIPAGKTVAV